MKKIAFFVEGQTELIFVERLLLEIAGQKKIAIRLVEERSKTLRTVKAEAQSGQEYFALIVDCGNDGRVASAMLERASGLVAAGYSKVLGLRDLHPRSTAELPVLSARLAALFASQPIQFKVHIAVMEVEAWFMQENLHFQGIDAACTRPAIKSLTGFDIEVDAAETLPHPADTLHRSYQIGGRAYHKTRTHVERTVAVLDFENLYLVKRAVLPSLDRFLTDIEGII